MEDKSTSTSMWWTNINWFWNMVKWKIWDL